MISCENAGIAIVDHFREVTKMIEVAKGAKRKIQDYMLTRYVCYLIAQNGDSKKEEIAFAQALFGGNNTKKMKEKYGVKENRPLADFLPTLTIAAKSLATEMTNYNVTQQDMYGEEK